MGCPTSVFLGRNLVFSITTHDPDTGVLTDADALPTYRIYEDETAVPILIGNMAALDAVNTTGFYTAQIACTTANGFEYDRTYTIDIEATVDLDTGGMCYGFIVFRDVWSALGMIGASGITLLSPVLDGGNVNIIQGDVYEAVDGRRLEWSNTGWTIGVASTIIVVVRDVKAFVGVRISGTEAGLEMTSVETLALTVGTFDYYVQEIQADNERITLVEGKWTTSPRPIPPTV